MCSSFLKTPLFLPCCPSFITNYFISWIPIDWHAKFHLSYKPQIQAYHLCERVTFGSVKADSLGLGFHRILKTCKTANSENAFCFTNLKVCPFMMHVSVSADVTVVEQYNEISLRRKDKGLIRIDQTESETLQLAGKELMCDLCLIQFCFRCYYTFNQSNYRY